MLSIEQKVSLDVRENDQEEGLVSNSMKPTTEPNNIQQVKPPSVDTTPSSSSGTFTADTDNSNDSAHINSSMDSNNKDNDTKNTTSAKSGMKGRAMASSGETIRNTSSHFMTTPSPSPISLVAVYDPVTMSSQLVSMAVFLFFMRSSDFTFSFAATSSLPHLNNFLIITSSHSRF
jgi:hypothetical protein